MEDSCKLGKTWGPKMNVIYYAPACNQLESSIL